MARLIKKFKDTLKKNIFIFKTRQEIRKKKKINVGSGKIDFDKTWYSCDKNILDITKKSNWNMLLGYSRLKNIFAEHVWEHLNEVDTELANKNCYKFLRKSGRLRLAVPDGFNPNKDYIDYVKPNGTGLGADNYSIMKDKLEKVGFKVELLEYWDEHGEFHYTDWENEHGKVIRSKRYDNRNSDGKLNYTSLIVDAIK